MCLEDVVRAIRLLVADRNWDQFHTPSNLAKSISIEAAELLELFQWSDEASYESVKDELADILTYCLLLADKLSLDPMLIVHEKLAKTEQKYPVDKSKGKSIKYDRL